MGTSGMTAQAIGAGHIAESHALLIRAVLIGLAGGFALIILQWPIFMLCLYAAPASAEVETLVRDYLFIRIYSAPAAIAMYGITGWLIAKEKTRASAGFAALDEWDKYRAGFVVRAGFGLGRAGCCYR